MLGFKVWNVCNFFVVRLMLRAMGLGWWGAYDPPFHERVLYPSHRPGGGVSKGDAGKGTPPPFVFCYDAEYHL